MNKYKNILLEQSSCEDGGWKSVNISNIPVLKKTGKFDFKQCEGKWYYKSKSSTPPPPDPIKVTTCFVPPLNELSVELESEK